MTEDETRIAEAAAKAVEEATKKAADETAAKEAAAKERGLTPEEQTKETADKEAAKKKLDDGIAAAIRLGKIEEARKLIADSEPKVPEVDLSGYVPKEQFNELLTSFGELKTGYETSNLAASKENIRLTHNLSEEDLKLIDTDDIKVLGERAVLLSGRNNQTARAAAVSVPIPDDLKDSDLASRLL